MSHNATPIMSLLKLELTEGVTCLPPIIKVRIVKPSSHPPWDPYNPTDWNQQC